MSENENELIAAVKENLRSLLADLEQEVLEGIAVVSLRKDGTKDGWHVSNSADGSLLLIGLLEAEKLSLLQTAGEHLREEAAADGKEVAGDGSVN